MKYTATIKALLLLGVGILCVITKADNTNAIKAALEGRDLWTCDALDCHSCIAKGDR